MLNLAGRPFLYRSHSTWLPFGVFSSVYGSCGQFGIFGLLSLVGLEHAGRQTTKRVMSTLQANDQNRSDEILWQNTDVVSFEFYL